MKKYTPNLPMGEFIDYLYLGDQNDAEIRLVPTHPHLIFRFGENPVLTDRIELVKGIHNRPLLIRPAAEHRMAGVCLKPYGLYTGFGIDGRKTSNAIVPGKTLFDKPFDITGASWSELTDDEMIRMVHDAVYKMLQPNQILFDVIEMIDVLQQQELSNDVQKKLARDFERSPKSFIEFFKKATGFKPLQYLHIYKVERAKEQIRDLPESSLTDIAYALGFYDQSHFTRIFRNHAGISPGRYRSQFTKG